MTTDTFSRGIAATSVQFASAAAPIAAPIVAAPIAAAPIAAV